MNDRIIEAGDGPLLVCLHGIGGSAESFRPQLDGLSDSFHVVARDAPGYAKAPAWPEYRGTAGYVREVVDLIEERGDRGAFLLGMSWGGVIALEVALAKPDLVNGLVLGDSTRGSGQGPEQAAAMLSRVDELRESGAQLYAQRRTARLLSPDAPAGLQLQLSRASGRSLTVEGFEHAARFMAESNLGPRLSEVSAPTLVIYGEDDIVTGEAESRALTEGIPQAQLMSLPGAGHLANQEVPERFNSAVRDYLVTLS